jgi:hypothetical protein
VRIFLGILSSSILSRPRSNQAPKHSVCRHYKFVFKFSMHHGYSHANLKQFEYLVEQLFDTKTLIFKRWRTAGSQKVSSVYSDAFHDKNKVIRNINLDIRSSGKLRRVYW